MCSDVASLAKQVFVVKNGGLNLSAVAFEKSS